MDGLSDSDTIPLPRLRTLLAAGVLGAIAWFVWGEWKSELDRQALWDTTAHSVKRIQAVGKFVELGAGAVPELIAALERGDDQARELAGMALAQIGPAASSAGPRLAELLSDPDEEMRLIALRALVRIRYPLEQAIPPISALLSAENPALRKEAISVLTSLGPRVIPAACRELQHSSGVARRCSAIVLGQVGEGHPAAIAALRACLADADGEVRGLCFRSLAQWGELTPEEAIAGLRASDPSIAAAAARYSGQLSAEAERVVPELAGLLAHDRSQVRRSALEGLAALGPEASSAIPDVLSRMERARFHERSLALRTLGQIGAGDARLVPRVEPYLLDGHGTAEAAGNALRRLSPEAARSAAPALAARLAAADGETRARAAAALDGLGEEARDVVPALVDALGHGNGLVRFHVAGALAQIGPAAEAAIPQLARLVQPRPAIAADRRPVRWNSVPTRVRVIAALGSVGPNSDVAIDALLNAAASAEPAVRSAVVDALARTACHRETLIELLAEALSDPSGTVRAHAALGLVQARVDPHVAVPLLESVLSDGSVLVRKAAAAALGEFGAGAAASREMLEEIVSQPNAPTFLDTEGREAHTAWVSPSESGQPIVLLTRRSMRSIAAEALRKVDGRPGA